MQKKHRNSPYPARAGRQVLFGMTAIAGLISQAYAQEAAPAPAQAPVVLAQAATPAQAPAADQGVATPIQSVVVTGYKGSLETSARDKRNAVGFQDTVFAEDLGKFPDTNIAESMNRIPGIEITRDIDGTGTNIQIRGLGTSFTKVLLNGSPVAVASTGTTDSQNTNREVDLDMLPTELFKKITVTKSPTAEMIEGGAAGTVDMRQARPFDNPGEHVAGTLNGMRNTIADKDNDSGSVLGSNTYDNGFGILAGFAWNKSQVETKGFETVGWTTPNLSATQNTLSTRNNTGGGNWTIPSTVPANAGNGLVAGTVINQAFLLANNPGLTITQINNAIIPRLGRDMDETGSKDKGTGILSFEYRPNADLHFYLDTLASHKHNDLQREDMDWVGRNGAMIPLNMQVSDPSCTTGCVVTNGTYANSQFFLEYRPYTEDTTLFGINPGVEWKIAPDWKLDAQSNLTKSRFERDSPSVLVSTVPSSGLTVNYANTSASGDPIIGSNVNLNNPASFGWNSGSRVNVQDEIRHTKTDGLKLNLTWGDTAFNIKGGFAYDDISRQIDPKDNSSAYSAAVCGGNPSLYLPGPNTNSGPNCNGLTPTTPLTTVFPGYGKGVTAGMTAPLTYGGSLVPSTAVSSYLIPGPNGYISVNWPAFSQATNYSYYNTTAPEATSSNTSANGGSIDEKTDGFYLEANGVAHPFDHQLRYNAGVRYVRTEQTVGWLTPYVNPLNASLGLTSGAEYPTVNQFNYITTNYNDTLPSASAALNLTKDLILRTSVSKTMTRANPNSLLPNTNFSDPSAAVGTFGNINLKPYISDNLDVGLEWYTGQEGYLAATIFEKRINGFTANINETLPFDALAPYGITYNTLSPTQQQAINARGTPDTDTVVMTTTENESGLLHISGNEYSWVQPLDKWLPASVRGFGFSENVTLTHQWGSGPGSAGFIALGVPKVTNNLTAYYEHNGYSFRLTQSYTRGSQVSTPNQNGLTNDSMYSDSRKQLDLSSSIDLAEVLDKKGWPQISFNATNLGNAPIRTYLQYENATYSDYYPGITYSLGLRASF